ncbi:MAG: Lrp/AsnC family transcriptional regulator, partial [Dehalococcoidales bacterium]|nr:Lrp/AsnC family transcriptional regulator [Dehalococcoidales bacterium]
MTDQLDRELIIELQKDGRRSFVELAEVLHVSEATARNRMRRLLSSGIVKITAVPDLQMLGYQFIGIVGIQVRLVELRGIVEQLTRHANVCYLANVTGRYDLIGIIVTRSSREFADFIESTVSVIPGVDRTETFVSLNVFKGEAMGLDTLDLLNS